MEKQDESRKPNGEMIDPEVPQRPQRRRFTAKDKLRIVEAADRCTEPGAVGALLRREGIYSSYLTAWREECRSGALASLSKKRGPKPKKNPLSDEVDKLTRELAMVKRQLAQAEIIIGVQKKVASLLGIPLKTVDDDENDS
jgi:transposase